MAVTRYVYETGDGDPYLRVVRSDRKDGRKRIHQERPGEFGGWEKGGRPGPHPMYRLAALTTADPDKAVIVVEGEKCADALAAIMPADRAVVCWLGGTAAVAKTDWTPLRGREALLIADGDDPGHKAMKELAAHLHSINCPATLVLPPRDNTDVADWIESGGIGEVNQRVAGNSVPWMDMMPGVASLEDQINEVGRQSFTVLAEERATPLKSNEHYRILGVKDGHVHFEINRSRDSFSRPGNKVFALDTLGELAPLEWWQRMAGRDVLGKQEARSLGDSIVRMAHKMGMYDASAVLGRGAARLEDGEVVWHLGDRLLLGDGTETAELERHGQKFKAAVPYLLPEPASDAMMREVAESVLQYRWRNVEHGRRFLGWLVTALAGGALEWRPHIQLVAPASSGKTWLLSQVVKAIFGVIGHSLVDTTEAGLARGVGSDAVPVVLDEAEPDAKARVLSVLRAASGGEGQRWRASMSSNGIDVQAFRFSALLASTAAAKLNRADASRLVDVEFGPRLDSRDWHLLELRIRAAIARNGPAIRSRIIRDTAQIAAHADLIAADLRTKGVDSREALASAALTAGWCAWGSDQVIVRADVADDTMSDAADCLRELLETTVRTSGVEVSLWRLLCSELAADERQASDLGLQRCGDGLWLAYRHSGLARQLVRTRWANHDLLKLLEQLDGIGGRETVEFRGRHQPCLLIPAETLAVAGFVFPTATKITSGDGDPGPRPPDQQTF